MIGLFPDHSEEKMKGSSSGYGCVEGTERTNRENPPNWRGDQAWQATTQKLMLKRYILGSKVVYIKKQNTNQPKKEPLFLTK